MHKRARPKDKGAWSKKFSNNFGAGGPCGVPALGPGPSLDGPAHVASKRPRPCCSVRGELSHTAQSAEHNDEQHNFETENELKIASIYM